MPESEPMVPLWVEGEIAVRESELEQFGAIKAAQEELGHTGFRVDYAEEAHD